MSRIGKQPVTIPSGVTVTVTNDNVIAVKGPKGELKQAIDRDIKAQVKDGHVILERPTDQIRHRALHGLYRALVANLVKGVTDGYKKELELVGVGYKASNQGVCGAPFPNSSVRCDPPRDDSRRSREQGNFAIR